MERIACIGLDPPFVDAVKAKATCLVAVYDVPPRMYSDQGKLYADRPTVSGRFWPIDRVIWYSYFPGDGLPRTVRKAIALSKVPSFPDVRRTILHDDRVNSLLLAEEADPEPRMARGYLAKHARCNFEESRVLKVGDDHCGDGKRLIEGALPEANESGVLEPFIKGESIRVLLVGKRAWSLKYESADWRKNVRATVTEIAPSEHPTLVPRSRTIHERLGMPCLGVDFIGSDAEGWHLLEVNAYPGLDDVVEAQETFREMLCAFVS